MVLLQILAIILFLGLITLAVLAFIEPGPLTRRSRDRRGRRPPDVEPESTQPKEPRAQ